MSRRDFIAPLFALAIAFFLDAPAEAKIYRPINLAGDPPNEIAGQIANYLFVDVTRDYNNTALSILSADLPSSWEIANENGFWIARSTPSMWVWATDYYPANMTGVITIHNIDMTPYAALPSLDWRIEPVIVGGGLKSRTYHFNGVPLTLSSPTPEPSSTILAIGALAGMIHLRRRSSPSPQPPGRGQ